MLTKHQWGPVTFICRQFHKTHLSRQTLKLTSLQWRHNGRDSVSNHPRHHCLLNRLLWRRSKKTSKHWPLSPVISPHKRPVTWKMFPFDDVIMWNWCIWNKIQISQRPMSQRLLNTVRYTSIKVHYIWYKHRYICLVFAENIMAMLTELRKNPITPLCIDTILKIVYLGIGLYCVS